MCSLFFISDLRELGLDPNNFELSESESLLRQLGQQIVKDPTKVSDELLNGLRKYYNDTEINEPHVSMFIHSVLPIAWEGIRL